MTHDSIVKRRHLKEIKADNNTNNTGVTTNTTRFTTKEGGGGGYGATTDPVKPRMSEQKNKKQQPLVKLSDFEILKVLGKGAYGKVYQVRKQNGPDADSIFAMKSVSKSRIADSKTDMRHMRTERDVLVRVDHPFLIKMFYAFETSRRLYFVQEFCRGGELFRLMETEKMFAEDQARFYLCEIACALEYLHGMDIVYRDLKTENIMLDADGHIKLIDFGLSKIFENGHTLSHTFCGTVEYMAPEVVIRSPGHGKPADWWSFGIFMYDLLTGRSPFHSNNGKKDTKERILKGRFHIPPFISQDGADLLRRLIRRNVERRLGSRKGASEVKSHVFFAGIDWEMVKLRAYQPPHVPKVDRFDEADVSQFDPRFTSRTPRESERRGDLENQFDGDEDEEEPFMRMFRDFEFVSQECVRTMRRQSQDSLDCDLVLEPVDEEYEDDLVIRSEEVSSRVMQLEFGMQQLLHMRSHGD